MDRRRVLAGLGAVGLAGTVSVAARAAGPAGLPDVRQLQAWTAYMANLGPRYAGNTQHRAYVDFLAQQFEGLGLTPKRDRVSFEGWEAQRWSLHAKDGKDEVAIEAPAYYPFSGETPDEGVEAELVWLDGPDPAGRDVKGKICAFHSVQAAASQAEVFAPNVIAVGKQTQSDVAMGNSPMAAAVSTPALNALRDAGAVGAIIVKNNVADLCLSGLYAPFTRPHQGLPALLLSTRGGEALKRYRTVRLTLCAERKPTWSEHLSAEIPGASPETIVILSHSDGPNAFQENGSVGVLAMAHHLARLPLDQRPRTVRLACVEGHLAPHPGRDTKGWLAANPDVQSRTVAFIVMEHMGATEWFAWGKESHPTGRPDQSILSVSNHPNLQAAAAAAFKRAELENAVCMKPLPSGDGGKTGISPGLAGYPNSTGIPTVGYITTPPYLMSAAHGHHLDKFDAHRMHAEIDLLVDVFHTVARMDAEHLRSA